jgi:hypothetical protein
VKAKKYTNSKFFEPAIMMDMNASGAMRAALRGDVVLVVDVIDMSTSAEALLEQNPLALFGASLDNSRPPVAVNPWNIGKLAGEIAISNGVDVVVVAEPRLGDEKRKASIAQLLAGIKYSGADHRGPFPNIGAELGRHVDAAGQVVVIASATGGVAWDTAFLHGAALVLTGTIARTIGKKGAAPAELAASRALEAALRHSADISVIAASGNSLEDILASQYICMILRQKLSELTNG